jgi:hypothetical protein
MTPAEQLELQLALDRLLAATDRQDLQHALDRLIGSAVKITAPLLRPERAGAAVSARRQEIGELEELEFRYARRHRTDHQRRPRPTFDG